MSKKTDKELLQRYTAVPHARAGNERAWSVTSPDMYRGQIVHVHAMSGAITAIRKAIAQDAAELIANRNS